MHHSKSNQFLRLVMLDGWAHCAPLLDVRLIGLLWWLPVVYIHQGGTAMSRHKIVGIGIVVVVLFVIGVSQLEAQSTLTLQSLSERIDKNH